jgi:hypothetical protein
VPHWFDHVPVFTPRSSNRTGRFSASGSRTKLHAFTHGTSCPSLLRRTSLKCPYGGDVELGVYGGLCNAFGQGDTKTAAAKPDAAKGSEVEVKVKEYTIEMTTSVGAGPTTFKVTNTGKETHGFEIEGNGIEKEIKPMLKQGKRRFITGGSEAWHLQSILPC